MILVFRVFTDFCRPAILSIRYLNLSYSSSSYTIASSSWSSWSWRFTFSISSCEYHFPMLLSRRVGLFPASYGVVFFNLYMLNSFSSPSVLLSFLFLMATVHSSVPSLLSFSFSFVLFPCFLSFLSVIVALELKYSSIYIAS